MRDITPATPLRPHTPFSCSQLFIKSGVRNEGHYPSHTLEATHTIFMPRNSLPSREYRLLRDITPATPLRPHTPFSCSQLFIKSGAQIVEGHYPSHTLEATHTIFMPRNSSPSREYKLRDITPATPLRPHTPFSCSQLFIKSGVQIEGQYPSHTLEATHTIFMLATLYQVGSTN
jgi:hypothetical protein